MRQTIGNALDRCALELGRLSKKIRRLPPTQPPAPSPVKRTLGKVGDLTSETTLSTLQVTNLAFGPDAADDMAAGFCAGAMRFWAEKKT